ncbi:MAG: EcoRI family type II restriction endonuclease [Actinomycetota bacterium]
MAEKHRLRLNRAGTIINATSKQQESGLIQALKLVVARIAEDFDVELHHEGRWDLQGIVNHMRKEFPDIPFFDPHPGTFISPDGGILYIKKKNPDHLLPILISEVKNQGTNDLRAAEGKPKQARGNAIERLGKNVIGFRTVMLTEDIMPFVCFGYGIDFEDTSSILDRVATINMFGPLNEINVVNLGDGGQFNRGSFFFRQKEWSVPEMEKVMYEIASRSIHYYIARYGKDSLAKDQFIAVE